MSDTWTGSVIDKHTLQNEIARFMRTHTNGGQLLLDWLESVPPDRTEEEYKALKDAAALYMPSGWFE